MCGFTITREKIQNKISHRGIKENNYSFSGWEVNFNSLPLSSFQTGIEQPVRVKNLLLVFNGEIFNYNQLIIGCKSDVHYLVKLIEKLNYNIIDFYKESIKWDGFWAISIINSKGDIYSFTDNLGKKQLFFSEDGISSEIKPLLKKPILKDYKEKHFGTMNTNFIGIDRFLPGELFLYKKTSYRPYSIGKNNFLYDLKSTDLYSIIDGCVKSRLVNRYDGISLLLSGGLDSNIILHHTLKYTKDVEILTIENGETESVIRICEKNGLIPNIIEDSFTDEELKKAVYHYEYSLDYGSLLPNFLLFKHSKNSLVLTGDGSDEFFCGYNRTNSHSGWIYDVFYELPYYHNIRIDRMSMAFTKEARSPLMSQQLLCFSARLNKEEMKGKSILRKLYSSYLPDFIIKGVKKPLRYLADKELNRKMVKDKHKAIFNVKNVK